MAVIAFRSSYRDRSFSPGSYERETFALSSLETVTEALLEIMEVDIRLDCFSLLESLSVDLPPLVSARFSENFSHECSRYLFSMFCLGFFFHFFLF